MLDLSVRLNRTSYQFLGIAPPANVISLCNVTAQAFMIDWTKYPVGFSGFLALPPASMTKIAACYVDNIGGVGTIYVRFPDTGYILTCPPNSSINLPVFTSQLQVQIFNDWNGPQNNTQVVLLDGYIDFFGTQFTTPVVPFVGGSTISPTDKNVNIQISNNNLTMDNAGNGYNAPYAARGTKSYPITAGVPIRYFEVVVDNDGPPASVSGDTWVGLGKSSASLGGYVGQDANAIGFNNRLNRGGAPQPYVYKNSVAAVDLTVPASNAHSGYASVPAAQNGGTYSVYFDANYAVVNGVGVYGQCWFRWNGQIIPPNLTGGKTWDGKDVKFAVGGVNFGDNIFPMFASSYASLTFRRLPNEMLFMPAGVQPWL